MKHLSRRLRYRFVLWMLAVCAGLGAASVPALQPFGPGSLEEIRKANRDRPFLIAFWSLHCAPCKEDLELLTAAHARYPQVPIVLVAADGPAEHAAVARYLGQWKLGRIGVWAFADDFAERIRYSVDPGWGGELPRTYFFEAGGSSTAHTGVLKAKELEAWFKRVMAPAKPSG
jgi:thiol-disulfide isomerase/thioredoxin